MSVDHGVEIKVPCDDLGIIRRRLGKMGAEDLGGDVRRASISPILAGILARGIRR